MIKWSRVEFIDRQNISVVFIYHISVYYLCMVGLMICGMNHRTPNYSYQPKATVIKSRAE